MTIRGILGFAVLLANLAFAQSFDRKFDPPKFRPPVVAGLPYSAQTFLEGTQTLRDGKDATRTISGGRVYRDTLGRVRTEDTLASHSGTLPIVQIQDAVSGVLLILDPQTHVAHRFQYPPASTRPAAPVTTTPVASQSPAYTAKHETLGQRVIEGIEVEGMRDTLSYPSGTWGYDRPISTVHDRWTSKELRITIRSENTLPDEQMVSRLTNVSRLEPDPLLFQVPPGYTIVDEKDSITIKITRP